MLACVQKHRSLNRGAFLFLGLSGVGILFLAAHILQAVEIAPASAGEILSALGPDARGLSITKDALPDLFALTASRIEENPKLFTVEEPYLSGRWKGGKAIIEYARDLSYTLVSIYDREGRRQRIYSVRTKFNEHIAREEAETEPVVEVDNAKWERTPSPPPTTIRTEATVATTNVQPNVSYEWDDARGAYLPVVAGRGASSVEERSAAEAPSSAYRRHRHRHHAEMVVASAPTPPASAPVVSTSQKQSSLPAPMQDSGIWLPANTKSKDRSKSKSLRARTKEMKAANATWVERTNTKTRDEWVPKSIQENPSSTTETKTPLAASSERPSRRSRVHRETSEPSEPTPVTARESLPAPTSVKATPLMAAPKITESAVPSTEELIARPETKGGSKTQTGPDTSASDSWVPKATPKPAVVEPEMPEPPKESMKVASLPKSRPVDNSVDNLLKMAEQGKGEMPHESDHWVPRKTAMPNPEVDLNKEIARVREQERQQAAATKPKVQIRHDVNNPEEGVLPVSSFEKFSGPLYGRHREYERRFYPGKHPKSNVPHDFYVDEVDRKKEIHNIYYYQHLKGKAPKLVAVERHERVSFMGNYDIEKEDKGQISEYN